MGLICAQHKVLCANVLTWHLHVGRGAFALHMHAPQAPRGLVCDDRCRAASCQCCITYGASRQASRAL
jgi:hypothetical protein